MTNTNSAPMAYGPESRGKSIFRRRSERLAPLKAAASVRLAGMESMAFFSMVIRNGKTCRLITSTRPAREKNQFSEPLVNGSICCRSPRFCMNRIQPIDAMYGGVMNGIMKMMSNAFMRENLVEENRNARG
ncbi:MAG: hypothetical protein LKE39_03230 [Sphaerochaeta sp.]|nr:hypothetical protein [Sphaerochaeta sp.]